MIMTGNIARTIASQKNMLQRWKRRKRKRWKRRNERRRSNSSRWRNPDHAELKAMTMIGE
jgi:hypothetical protein